MGYLIQNNPNKWIFPEWANFSGFFGTPRNTQKKFSQKFGAISILEIGYVPILVKLSKKNYQKLLNCFFLETLYIYTLYLTYLQKL